MTQNPLIFSFEKVQRIPYRLCEYLPDKIDENLSFGSCLHKSDLLLKLLQKDNFECRYSIVTFDLSSLPIPNEILLLLNKSGTIRNHRFVEVLNGSKWIKIDPTWPKYLKKEGFPVTEEWKGNSDTSLVSMGKLEFHCFNEDYSRYPYDIKEKKDFYAAFNQWVEKVTPSEFRQNKIFK